MAGTWALVELFDSIYGQGAWSKASEASTLAINMNLSPSTNLGHYEILTRLGAGGMGESAPTTGWWLADSRDNNP